MKFIKYPSIDSYRTKTIEEIKKHGYDVGTWVVTNKIHGANFSIWYDGEKGLCAKRTSFIEGKENFHNYQDVVVKNYNKYFFVYEYFCDKYKTEKLNFVMFGELFGGSYPHPDVKLDPHSSRIQKGVYYCPHNDFYVYDIKVNNIFIPYDELEFVCKKYGFIYAKPLFKGSFEDCLKFNPVFEDTTYKIFGLPKIENNQSEGVVIRPLETKFFKNGSRCILKNKNPKFKEKTAKKKKIKVDLPEHVKERIESISQYVTENRLRNVLSHGEKIGQKDFGKLMKLFVYDVYEDYEKDYDSIYKGIKDKKEMKLITKSINKKCSDLIRPHFVNIIDGTF